MVRKYMNIRLATAEDASELQRINDVEFGEVRNYTELLNSSSARVFVFEQDGEIQGISGLKKQSWNNTAWILNIFVRPAVRQQGIGRQLIEHMVDEAKKLGVRCVMAEAPSNSNAPALFRNSGWRQCGYNDRYYTNDAKEIAEFYSLDFV